LGQTLQEWTKEVQEFWTR
jgi:hypothetical protein